MKKALEKTAFMFLGSVPRPVGTHLRNFFYRGFFAAFGKGIYIQEGVEFFRADNIFLGDEIKVLRHVALNADNQNSRLTIGSCCCLDRGVIISAAGDDCTIEIGPNSYIGPYSCISGPGNIKIGKGCLIASMCGIFASQHVHVGKTRKGIVIEDDCWLGSGVKVMDGVTIGRGSVIGAGAVVTHDIPPYSVAVGIPARPLKGRKTEHLNPSEYSGSHADGRETTLPRR
jgi:acetyltransferase-like isoleucine patch superfamily enzyme